MGTRRRNETDCISMVSSIFRLTAWSERSSKQRITAQKDNRRQTASQNTYFLERYGRNDFQKLVLPHRSRRLSRLSQKYIEKSGERLVYGGKLPAYFESDVLDEDIIVPYGIDDRKAVLADDFLCMVEGADYGQSKPGSIEKMPKVN